MANRKVILVLDLGSSSGRAFIFSLPKFEIIGSSRFDVSDLKYLIALDSIFVRLKCI